MYKFIQVVVVSFTTIFLFVEPLYTQYQKTATLVKDAAIFEEAPNANTGASTLFSIQKLSINGLGYSLIFFDLPTLPQNALITDAELSLYCFDKSTTTVKFDVGYLGIPSWSESAVTWNNKPSINLLSGFNFDVGRTKQYTNYDVTGIVKLWYNAEINNGFVLIPATNETSASFYSKDNGSNYAPILKIKYNIPPPPPKDPNPSDGAINQPTTSILRWTGGGNEVSYYKVYFGTDPTLSNDADNKGNVTNTYYDPGTLNTSTTYYWGIGAVNSAGLLTWNSGGPWQFKTTNINPPSPPSATTATNITKTSFKANWNSVANSAGYQLDVSTSNMFATYVSGYNNKDVGITNSWDVTGLVDNTLYYYRLRAYNNIYDVSENSNTISTSTTSVEKLDYVVPQAYYLSQNYPNPFNPSTNIAFGLVEESTVSLNIYNMVGQIVKVVLDRETLSAGTYNYNFLSDLLPSGIYLYVINSNSTVSNKTFRSVKKMILLK
ncbi:MAG: DNRLRE domain-containing protein [Ignavibacteriaceae bacterium]|jgi:hypothetical protein